MFSLYMYDMWRDIQPMLLPEHSDLFWDKLSRGGKRPKTSIVRNALRLRYGAFWNAKWPCAFKSHTSANHPMASVLYASSVTQEPNTGACAHRHMRGRYIERHNEAVRMSKAFMEGRKGGALQR